MTEPKANVEPELPEGTYNVNNQLSSMLVDISTLHEDPDNCNDHDGESYDAIAESYRTFKQQKPLVCNSVGKVLTGNGQLIAARDLLRWSHIACIKFDSEEEAMQAAFALADNKTAELSSWKWGTLAETLHSLPEPLQLSTGFRVDEIEAIIANSPWAGMADDQVPGGEQFKGQKFVRLRIRDAGAIDAVMADLKSLVTKHIDKLEILD